MKQATRDCCDAAPQRMADEGNTGTQVSKAGDHILVLASCTTIKCKKLNAAEAMQPSFSPSYLPICAF
jgi:hypothetical protein